MFQSHSSLSILFLGRHFVCPLKFSNVTFRIDEVHRLVFTNVRASSDCNSFLLASCLELCILNTITDCGQIIPIQGPVVIAWWQLDGIWHGAVADAKLRLKLSFEINNNNNPTLPLFSVLNVSESVLLQLHFA